MLLGRTPSGPYPRHVVSPLPPDASTQNYYSPLLAPAVAPTLIDDRSMKNVNDNIRTLWNLDTKATTALAAILEHGLGRGVATALRDIREPRRRSACKGGVVFTPG